MATRMQQRRGTAAQWTEADPILAAGEIGFETDEGKLKIGDGTNTWSDLPYFVNETGLGGSLDGLATEAYVDSAVSALVDSAPGLLDTLNELAAAIGDDPNFLANVVAIEKKTTSQWDADTDPIAAGTLAYDTTTSFFKIGDGTNSWSSTPFMWDGSQVSTHVQTQIATLLGTSAVFTGTVSLPSNTTLDGTNLRGQITSLSDDVTDLQTASSTAATQIGNLETDVENLQTASGDLDQEISNVAGDVATLRSDVDTLQSDLGAANSDIASLETSVGTANTNISSLQTSIGTANTNISNLQTDVTTLQGELDTAESSLASVVSDFDLHDAKTTNVHGIADTSVLATTSEVAAAETNAEAYADGILSTHTADTTNVHGISDTAQLAYLDAANQTFTGNMEVDGNLVVDGNLTVNGTEFLASSTSIVIEDNMLQLAHNQTGNTVDLGLVVAYNDGTYRHAGIVRDVSDAKWKLFKNVATDPTTTVDFASGSLDDLQVGAFEATSVTATSATIGGVAFTEKADKTATINTMSGSHTVVLADVNNIREMSNGGTFTIPADNAFWPVGQRVEVVQTGASQVTIGGGAGVTINATPGLKLRAQWSGATIIKRAANTFVVLGDLAV
jgi:cytoskeletal protein CcmA (bactofilin family)